MDDISVLNDVEIRYYGKIEDQFGEPLPGTDVEFSVQYYNRLQSGVKNGKTQTDALGLFEISGYRGERKARSNTGFAPLTLLPPVHDPAHNPKENLRNTYMLLMCPPVTLLCISVSLF